MKYICRYCGKECKNANSLAQHEVRCKENPNRIITAIELYNKSDHKGTNQYIKAKELGLPKPKLTEKGRQSISNIWKGKHLPDEIKEKISKSQRKFYEEHPDRIPYRLHHSSHISYPEQYFKNIFEHENIPLKYHLQVGLYELDFYNEEYKVYVEIDGDTHKQKKVQDIDKRKDNYLQSLGWRGMRIDWSKYQKLSYSEKEIEIKKIKDFIIL